MTEIEAPPPWSQPLRAADLPPRKATSFDLVPDAETLRALAEALGVLDLRKLRFQGEIRPVGKSDWILSARLGATVVQPCVVTLKPVTTRLDEDATRKYLARIPEIESGSETEMPDDESTEKLGEFIDPGVVMAEALALALPLYPRAKGAALDQTGFTAPGQTPLSDDDVKPFAGLKSLRDKLEDGDD